MPSDSLSAEPHHGEHREHRESRGIEHRPQTQKSLPLAGFSVSVPDAPRSVLSVFSVVVYLVSSARSYFGIKCIDNFYFECK
jgi:hypothetical protein